MNTETSSQSATGRPGPLAGIKVVEWAHLHMGPGAGMFLADLGAEVIHVEQRGSGDGMRRVTTLWGVDYGLAHDRNAFTEDLLRSKRSLAIDVACQEGAEVIHRLLDDADVFLTNMRHATLTQTGIDYASLSERHPGLVYCHGTAFGDQGPEASSPGNEMMGLARSGMMLGSAPRGSEPVYPTAGVNDRLGAIGMAFGILGALVARERTGIGQLVETSLLGWMINLQVVAAQIAANTEQDPRPTRRDDANDPLYNYYQCRDGVWIALGMLGYGDRFWPALCESLGIGGIATDPRYATEAAREENRADLIALLDERFASIDSADWDRIAKTHDFISTRINSLPDLAADAQVIANDYITELPHPELGSWRYVPTPLKYSETPVSIRGAAPHIGEQTTEILREIGFTDDEIRQLEQHQVI